MLFKRLFNWIKYKTLPPSLLFKNRLFVERDSKTRRVTSNLGLTYRNSKWANYTRTDIPTNAKQSYINFIKVVCSTTLVLVIILFYAKYYTTTTAFNDVFFFFWWFKDTTFYYLFTVFGVWTILSTTLVEKFFAYFLLVNSDTSSEKVQSSTLVLNEGTTYKFSDYKYIYYNWLTNSSTTLNFQNDLENLFEVNQDKSTWASQTPLLVKTFKTSFKLHRSIFTPSLDLFSNSNFNSQFKSLLNTQRFQLLELNYLLNSRLVTFNKNTSNNFSTSLKFLNTVDAWNLNKFVNTSEKHTNLLNITSGSFYTTNWNFAKYNSVWVNQPTAHILYESLENQLNSLKVSKFLYHYSYLHRNILKNSHKLTMVKKLISSGFYDTKLISNNMWASDTFGKLNNPGTVLNSELNLVYGNFFNNHFFNDHLLNNYSINTSINSLNLLSFYEKSYFWTLKRLHNFNSLFANNIKFSLKPFTQSSFNLNVDTNSSLNNVTNSFKSDLVTTNRFLNYNQPYQNTNFSSEQSRLSLPSTKDLFLLKTELSLVTADEENVLIELSNSPSSSKPLFPFFTNNNSNTSSYLVKKSFSRSKLTSSRNFKYTSINFSNHLFLNDLRRLALFL